MAAMSQFQSYCKECVAYEILLLPRILLFFLLDISLHKKLKIVQTTESYELFQLLE